MVLQMLAWAQLLLVFNSFDRSNAFQLPSSHFHNKATVHSRELCLNHQSNGNSDKVASENPQREPPQRSSTQRARPKGRGHQRKPYQAKRPQQGNRQTIQRTDRPDIVMNKKITAAESSLGVLAVLQQNARLQKVRAGDSLRPINFSTAIHRLAKHAAFSGQYKQQRAIVISDARTALLLSSLVEVIGEGSVLFVAREFSNICWALAKLKLPPPADAMALSTTKEEATEKMVAAALQVRNAVLEVAANRDGLTAQHWVPALSQLTGHLMDFVGQSIVLNDDSTSTFQIQEYTNLIWAWATAGRADPSVFDRVSGSIITQQRERLQLSKGKDDLSNPQEWSNSIWGFATAKISATELIEFFAKLLETHPGYIEKFKTQEMSNTVWGIATLLSKGQQDEGLAIEEERAALSILRCVFKTIVGRRAEGLRSQEISNSLWAMATVGFGLSQSKDKQKLSANNYVILQSDESEQDSILMRQTVDCLLKVTLAQLPSLKSQELNNVAWALARLIADDHDMRTSSNVQSLLAGIGHQLSDRRRFIKSQDIGTTLWSMASLQFTDADVYRGVASRIDPHRVRQYKPQELSNSVWALATAGISVDGRDMFDTTYVPQSMRQEKSNDPATICLALGAQELMRRPHEFKSQETKDILWSFSKLEIRHPALFKFVAEHLVGDEKQTGRGVSEFNAQGLGNMAWAFARQAQLSEGVFHRLKLSGSSNGRLAVYRAAYFDLGEKLLRQLCFKLAQASVDQHEGMRKSKPQDIANMAWAFAVLGLKHTAFLDAGKFALDDRLRKFVRGDRSSLNNFKGQELANLLWAFGTLNVPPGQVLSAIPPFVEALCKDSKGRITASSIAKQFNRQEIANMIWACAVFEEFDENLMSLLYKGMLGTGSEQDASYMTSLYDDGGMQPQAIMTLIYVQSAFDLKGCCQTLSLPENFPNGWMQSRLKDDSSGNLMSDISDELTLSTSKIQRSVSSAFSRIGFDHVEEHTMTMADLARDYDVRVAPNQMEIFSIDLANVAGKIGIEVDGPSHFMTTIDDERSHSSGVGFCKNQHGKREYQFSWTGELQDFNGPSALKNKLLSDFGWRILHVPFWEWQRLDGDAEKEEDYCRSLLQS